MEPRLADGGLRVAVGAAGRVDVRDDLGARALDLLPAGVDALQEGQVAFGMDGGDGQKPVVVRLDDGTAGLFDAFLQRVDARGLFGAGGAGAR